VAFHVALGDSVGQIRLSAPGARGSFGAYGFALDSARTAPPPNGGSSRDSEGPRAVIVIHHAGL
jgi:hypothetical protein